MNTPTRSEILFSVKSFAAAMLSVYISMRIGLPRPFWAMMTSYICAAPFAGPVRSKGLYRAGGTVLGAIAVTFAFLITSPLVNEVAVAMFLGSFGMKVTVIYVVSGVLLGMIGAAIGEYEGQGGQSSSQ